MAERRHDRETPTRGPGADLPLVEHRARQPPVPARWPARSVVTAVATATLLTACGTTGPDTTSPRTSTAPTAAATPTSAPAVPGPTPTSTSPTTPSGRFIPATTPVSEFYAPSRNISCEIDDATTGNPRASVLCETFTPAQSVTMVADGSLQTCTGAQCESNPGLGTPVLSYGDSTGVGPFTCTSTVTGMVCTAIGGRGFSISRSGITPIGG